LIHAFTHSKKLKLCFDFRCIAFFLCLLFPYLAEGQKLRKKCAVLPVAANVISFYSVEIVPLQHLCFSGGRNLSGDLYISPFTCADAGLMLLKGEPGSVARVRFLPVEELREEGGSGRLFIQFMLSGNFERIQHASRMIDSCEIHIRFKKNGMYYLWIGGLVDLSGALPGMYTGEFTLEVDYI
jgi:hypothetical protein